MALGSGGHTELIAKGGELFKGRDDVLGAIDKVNADIEKYRDGIQVSTMEEACKSYILFAEEMVG